MTALGIDDQVALVFQTVLNELSRGLEEEDEEPDEVVDRSYWESKVGTDILDAADRLVGRLRLTDPKLEVNYNKYSIGLAKAGGVDKFASFRLRRQFLRVEARLPQAEDTDALLEHAGLDVMPWKWGRYRIRLTRADLTKHEDVVVDLLERAYRNPDS